MFEKFRIEKLKRLVAGKYGSSENPWISVVEMKDAVFDPVIGDGVPVDLMRDWYLIRASENEKGGNTIDGFELLIKNLTSTHARTVFVHGMLDSDRRRYSILTDSEVNELIGMLRYPEPSPRNQSSFRTKKLKALIVNSFGSSENPWISKSDAEEVIFDVADGRGILLSQIQNIYSSRGRRNEKRGSPIDGFECLLKNLDITQAKEVLIHGMVDFHGRNYRIFTDLEINELIGLLRFSNKK
jgi:hypothetical protein